MVCMYSVMEDVIRVSMYRILWCYVVTSESEREWSESSSLEVEFDEAQHEALRNAEVDHEMATAAAAYLHSPEILTFARLINMQ